MIKITCLFILGAICFVHSSSITSDTRLSRIVRSVSPDEENLATAAVVTESALEQTDKNILQTLVRLIATPIVNGGHLTEYLILSPVNFTHRAIETTENGVILAIDQVREIGQYGLKSLNNNTLNFSIIDCGINLGKTYQGVFENIYKRGRNCLTDRIDELVYAVVGIVREVVITAENAITASDDVSICLKDGGSLLCYAQVLGLFVTKVLFSSKNIGIELARIPIIIQALPGTTTICATKIIPWIVFDLLGVAFNTVSCLFW